MRVLEALKMLEAAMRECKRRPIDTPKVSEALNTIERHVETKWYVESFRRDLRPHLSRLTHSGVAAEGQQQNLRVNFAGIHRCVRNAMLERVTELSGRYLRGGKDPKIRAEIDRLNAELDKLPEGARFWGVVLATRVS